MSDQLQEFDITLTRQQLATIIAALRHYQIEGFAEPSRRPEGIDWIATDCGELEALDDEGIEALIDWVNRG